MTNNISLHHTPTNYTDDWRMSPHPLRLDFVPTAITDLFSKLSSKDHSELNNYLQNRGISEKTYQQFDVRVSETGELAFLFKNILGNCLGVVFRNVIDKKIRGLRLELLEWEGIFLPKKAKAGAWFGIDISVISQPLIIVEGEMDCMRVYELTGGRNISVMSPGGMSVTKQQMRAIYNKEIYLGFDADSAGDQGMRQFVKMADSQKTIWKLDWSLVGCKDPGELTSLADYETVLQNKVKLV